MAYREDNSARSTERPLPLGLRTEGIPKLVIHRVITGTDGEGNVVSEETGWGPDPYADAPEGWSFTYTTCLAPG